MASQSRLPWCMTREFRRGNRWGANTPHHILPGVGGDYAQEVANVSKWVTYEQLKAELRAGKLTPAQYEQAIKKLVKELRL